MRAAVVRVDIPEGEAADVEAIAAAMESVGLTQMGPISVREVVEVMDEADVEAIKAKTARLEDRTTITRTIEITKIKTMNSCLNTWKR
jgi:hypothetical protein